jgi:hypothetical protein
LAIKVRRRSAQVASAPAPLTGIKNGVEAAAGGRKRRHVPIEKGLNRV